MEATFQVISNLCDIRDMVVFDSLSIFFSELKLNFIGEEKFEEEVHDLLILLELIIVIQEHLNTSCYK